MDTLSVTKMKTTRQTLENMVSNLAKYTGMSLRIRSYQPDKRVLYSLHTGDDRKLSPYVKAGDFYDCLYTALNVVKELQDKGSVQI